MATIGEKIKTIRKKNNLTQKEFGERLGISDTHVSGIELGKDNPSNALVQVICTKFSIDKKMLLDDSIDNAELKFHNIDSLSNRFNELMEDNGLNRAFLMKKLGLSSTDFFLLESGNPNVDLNSLIKVSDFFDISLDFLIKGKEHSTLYSADLSIDEVIILKKYRKAKNDEKTIIKNLLDKFVLD